MKIKLPIVVKTYRVASHRLDPDLGKPIQTYRVDLYSDGKLECDCIAGQMRHLCRHKIITYKFIQKHEPERELKTIRIPEGR